MTSALTDFNWIQLTTHVMQWDKDAVIRMNITTHQVKHVNLVTKTATPVLKVQQTVPPA